MLAKLGVGLVVLWSFAAAFVGLPNGEEVEPAQAKPSATETPTRFPQAGAATFDFPDPWPAPLAKPKTDPADLAWFLAQKVLGGGPDALPAVQLAALECGYAIHAADGTPRYKPDPEVDVGLAFTDLDLVTAVELTRRHQTVKLKDIQTFFASKGFKDIPFAELMKTTILEFDADYHPGKFFWGMFVSALSSRLDGEFVEMEELTPDAEITTVQATFLMYAAAGMAAVAEATRNGVPPGAKIDVRKPKDDEEEMDPGAEPASEPPPADEPPPARGPVVRQQTAPAQAVANLYQAIGQFNTSAYTNHVRNAVTTGQNANLAAMQFARFQILRIGMDADGTQNPDPLVRVKRAGQKGGRSTIEGQVKMKIPPGMRRAYNAALQHFPTAGALPADGPFDVLCGMRVIDDDLVENESLASSPGGRITFKMIGATQVIDYGAGAVPRQRRANVVIMLTPKGEPGCPSVTIPSFVNVQDWSNKGMYVAPYITVKGSGTHTDRDGNVTIWSVNRWMTKCTLLEFEIMGPMMENPAPPIQQMMNFTSWQRDPNSQVPYDFQYLFNDNYIFISRFQPGGCGVEDRRRRTRRSFRRVKDRPLDGPLQFSVDILQRQVPGPKYSFTSGFWSIPVTVTKTGADPLRTQFSVLDDVDLSRANRPGLELQAGVIVVRNTPETGEYRFTSPHQLFVGSGGRGTTTLNVTLDWTLRESGLNRPSPSPGPANPPPPPPPPPDGEPMVAWSAGFLGAGEGPEWWVDHGLSLPPKYQWLAARDGADIAADATCSELVVSDSMPEDRN